jgi:hypothetical protein
MDKGLQDMAVRFFSFSSGQAPEARPARCPMLTCNGRSCKCTSPANALHLRELFVLEATINTTRLQYHRCLPHYEP